MGKNKRSRSYYIQSAKRQRKGAVLGPGMIGFMCTCNFYERECVKEAYNVLNEFADTMYGKEFPDIEVPELKSENVEVDPETEAQNKPNEKDGIIKESKEIDRSETLEPASTLSDSDEEPLDIEAAIKADVSALKKNEEKEHKKVRRFQQVFCGAKNCVFIQTTLDDPLPLSLAIMDEILLSQKQRTKSLLRMIPVHATCKAYPEDIEKAVEKLASTYFKEISKSYCVVFKVRNNSSIKKENIVFNLASILQNANSKNSPDLNLPEVVLNVDIIKNVCCLSLLPHYFTKYSKYNLVLLANKNKTHLNEEKSEKGNVETEESVVKAEKGTVVSTEIDVSAEKGTVESTEIDVSAEKGTVESTEIDVSPEKSTKESTESVVNAEKGTMESTEIDVSAEKGTMESTEIDVSAEKGTMESTESGVNAEKGGMESTENIDKPEKDAIDSKETEVKDANIVEVKDKIKTDT